MSKPNPKVKDSRTTRRSDFEAKRERERFQQNISEAETSEDEKNGKQLRSRNFSPIYQGSNQKPADSNKKSNGKSIVLQNSPTSQKEAELSLTISIEQSQNDIGKIESSQEKNKKISLQKPSKKPKKNERHKPRHTTQEEIEDEVTDMIGEIQQFDFQSRSFEHLRLKFLDVCGYHLKLLHYLPQANTKVGDQLIKNGFFHVKWREALLKMKQIEHQSLFQSYYAFFRQKITKGVENFQKVFKSTTKEGQEQDNDLLFIKYRKEIEETTKNTTKMDVMMLYQQAKQELRSKETEERIEKKVQRTIQEWKVKTAEEELNILPIVDIDLMFEDQQTVSKKWNDEQEQKRRKQSIKSIEKVRVRERSPLSNRFRMMHQCQTNERRMQVEMACFFLKMEKFYYLSDLQIVKIEEKIFSQTQQIVVVKAYTIEFCPVMGMLKLEPKLKNLLAAYKFCGLSELIRLEKTYGAFDGIIVYPQSFDMQKYLSNNSELSLIKEGFLEQVKEQLPQQNDDVYCIQY